MEPKLMPDTAMPDSLIDSLIQVLGKENVLTDPFDLDRYSGDALSPTRAFGSKDAFDRLADVVARPGSTGDVCAVLKLANDKSLSRIAADLNDLTQRARDSKLKPEDVRGGTFTISNHGVSGSLVATPIIINQPQSAILGLVGRWSGPLPRASRPRVSSQVSPS